MHDGFKLQNFTDNVCYQKCGKQPTSIIYLQVSYIGYTTKGKWVDLSYGTTVRNTCTDLCLTHTKKNVPPGSCNYATMSNQHQSVSSFARRVKDTAIQMMTPNDSSLRSTSPCLVFLVSTCPFKTAL